MNRKEATQLMMDNYDKCNDLLNNVSQVYKNITNQKNCQHCIIQNQQINQLIFEESEDQKIIQASINEIGQRLLNIIHYIATIEGFYDNQSNIMKYLEQNNKNNDTKIIIKQESEKQKDQIIQELSNQLIKEQTQKEEVSKLILKNDAEYKSMQRKMEIYFKRRIENILESIKNFQLNYANQKQIDFTSLIKKLEKMRRRRPWREHNIDLLIEEDKKNLQLRFLEGDEDGTSTPFSNYSGILTTDYQLPIESQLEKQLNQGGYLEDLAFNSTLFHNNNSMSVISESLKKKPRGKNIIKNILRQYYDEMILPYNKEQDQFIKQLKLQNSSNQNNLFVDNTQSMNILLDQSYRPSAILGLTSQNQDLMCDQTENDNETSGASLNISAKESILLQIYGQEQITNSYILTNPNHVQIEDIQRIIISNNNNENKDQKQEDELEYILNEISESEIKINNQQKQDNKRKKNKKKQDQEDLNLVQVVNNNKIKLQNLGLSAILDDEIEPIDIQEKEKNNDHSKFSQLLADVSEIKINITQSKQSFSVQNTLNTPAHIQSQQNYDSNQLQNKSNLLGNFNNYLQNNFIQKNSQADKILVINEDQILNSQSSKPNNVQGRKSLPVSPHMVIKGILNGESAACISIYDDKTTKNAVGQNVLGVFPAYESNNNFLQGIDESKISRVLSSANNSFEFNSESKSTPNIANSLNNYNFKKRDSNSKLPKSSKFKDFSKDFLSNSEILNESSLKQDQQQSMECISLKQIPEKQSNQLDKSNNSPDIMEKQINGKKNNENQDKQKQKTNSQNEKEKNLKIEKNIQVKQSPNISLLLGENMNVSEIKKKNNLDDELQNICNNNLNLLSRDEKLFNDSKNNLSEFLDQFNSNNEIQRNNIFGGNTGNSNQNLDLQDEIKRNYTNVLDHLSSISDQEYNEQNSLKSPLKETVHQRFDNFENEKNLNLVDLLNSKDEENFQEDIQNPFKNNFNIKNTLINKNIFIDNNIKQQEDETEILISTAKFNQQTVVKQTNQLDQQSNILTVSVVPQLQQKNKEKFISTNEGINNNDQQGKEFENQSAFQFLINENNNIIELVKRQIAADNDTDGQQKERGLHKLSQKNQKEQSPQVKQKLFTSITSTTSPAQNLSKNSSTHYLEDDCSNFPIKSKKYEDSPCKNNIKSNVYLKNGIYSRPIDIGYTNKQFDGIRSLQQNSPKFEKKVSSGSLTSPQTPNKYIIQRYQDEQDNITMEDNNLSNKDSMNSASSTAIKDSNNITFNKSGKQTTKLHSYANQYHQYIRKSFNFSNSENKFSQEKQKILNIIQKKLDLVQTREFHSNIQQFNEYKQSKILMGNPFHRRQRSSFHEQCSTISFSQKPSTSSLQNIQPFNQNSLQNLSLNQNQNQINIKQKLLQNYSESAVEAAKRKLSCSPLKNLSKLQKRIQNKRLSSSFCYLEVEASKHVITIKLNSNNINNKTCIQIKLNIYYESVLFNIIYLYIIKQNNKYQYNYFKINFPLCYYKQSICNNQIFVYFIYLFQRQSKYQQLLNGVLSFYKSQKIM